jgi:hypothetical protein
MNLRFPFLRQQDEKAIQEMIDQSPEIFDHLSDQQIVAIYLNKLYSNE